MVLSELQSSWLFHSVYFCKHLHDLMGTRAYMAGIYEQQAAIKILFFKGSRRKT